MKKLEGRGILCLTLAAALILGVLFFTYRLFREGHDWAVFYANQHIYKDGQLTVGAVKDREGRYLLRNDKNGSHYSDDVEIRKANFHITGDVGFHVSTGANLVFRDKMIGYNIVTGTEGFFWKRGDLSLTIDSRLNKTAYAALGGRDGFVSVYNWKTGEILCMVSSPTMDPLETTSSTQVAPGTYLNKILSSTFTPGSIMKLVTTEAAIEEGFDVENWTFQCTGRHIVNGETITCPRVHGQQNLYDALKNSCNCAYGELAKEIGSRTLEKYIGKAGLTKSYHLDGIKTKKGSFDLDKAHLGWTGVGQWKDQINPLAMMVYVGAIAGKGETAEPYMVKGMKGKSLKIIHERTAQELGNMMRNNVKENYGDNHYPGLTLHAKSGTAETVPGKLPNGWFCGYTGEYAFIVCVENGGQGSQVAGPVANQVLQQLVTKAD